MRIQKNIRNPLEANSLSVSIPFFQPKLTLNPPNDIYEQEADAMADKVMRMPDSSVNDNAFFKPSISSIQRQCTHCKEEEKKAQRKTGSSELSTASFQTEDYINTLSGGKPLGKEERSFFEPRFGYDFSNVKIHTDSQASKSAEGINALAYTSGSNIVFNSGQYAPFTDSGKRLLGHELTHVVQQNSSSPSQKIQAQEAPATPVMDSPTTDQFGLTEEELANVGIFALGNVLRTNAADSVGFLRTLYNNGVLEIIGQRASMIRSMTSGPTAERIITALGNNLERSQMISILQRELSPAQAESIARTVSSMRHELALNTRSAGGMVLQRGAELIDSARGQARPTYEALIAAGRTDAEIIISATRTNRFVNRLPTGMRLAGGVLLVASAGFSIYLVISADPADRSRVAMEEAGGFAGGLLGASAGTAICVGAGMATGGFGLIVCGLIGGFVGGSIGRDPYGFLQLMDIAPHHSPSQQGRMYRLQGVLEEIDLFILSIPQTTVASSQHALVIATGMVSGELVGGRGHYRRYQVTPANQPSTTILGGTEPVYVPDFTLVPYSAEDLQYR